MESTRESDYAWAAGIVDGEGCLFIARKKAGGSNGAKTDQYVLGLKVTMGHEPTILRLRAMFGSGSKHMVEQPGWNKAYTWLVQSRLCEQTLDKLEPYIFTKSEEVKVAREFLSLPPWRNGRCRGIKSIQHQKREYDLWDRMRRLKPRTAHRLPTCEGRCVMPKIKYIERKFSAESQKLIDICNGIIAEYSAVKREEEHKLQLFQVSEHWEEITEGLQ